MLIQIHFFKLYKKKIKANIFKNFMTLHNVDGQPNRKWILLMNRKWGGELIALMGMHLHF